MKVCILQPDYTTSEVDYQYYDPKRYLSTLLPTDIVDHIFLNKLTTYKQLKELQQHNYDIFVNLCEGYLEWDIPSIDVIYSLQLLQLPFTGPTTTLYDPPKELMKYVAFCEGIASPAYVLVSNKADLAIAINQLKFPLFVKPAKAGDSLGIDGGSLVENAAALEDKFNSIIGAYPQLLVEEYIPGREFTVLVAANADGKTATSFLPVEYIFPDGFLFKTYALKTAALHPHANIPCTDVLLSNRLRDAALKIFKGFNGVGYARLDFRLNENNELFFLEINFTCSVFYSDGYEGSSDFILKYDGFGQAAFLQHIIAEGIARFKRSQKKYSVKGNAIAGFGIYATQHIQEGQVVFVGEGLSQRIITRRYVQENWSVSEKIVFDKYAYPLSEEVYLLWSNDPSDWAPQNHSCSPNTALVGLNVVASQMIKMGEELTLDYTQFLDDTMEGFVCKCGTSNCKNNITGTLKNSVTSREQNKFQPSKK